MSRWQSSAKRGNRGPALVLVFGENPNDTASIATLAKWLNPKLCTDVTVETRRDPPSLTRHAEERTAREWLARVASVVRIEEAKGSQVPAVLVHQDADGPDRAGLVEASLNRRLAEVFDGRAAHAVVPVSMTEAWWMIFPDAVRAVKKQAWRDLKLPTGDIERIEHAKNDLIAATKKVALKHPYSESDSRAIADNIVAQDAEPVFAVPSWTRFTRVCQSLV